MKTIASILAAAIAGGILNAAPQTFDFKDPKGVNNAVFKLDAPLESINGTASGVSGTLSYDPAKPEATTGKIIVSSASLHVANPVMKEHMHGNQWLDVANNPEISFEITKLSNVKPGAGGTATADVTGKFSLHGVSKEITVPAKTTYLPDKLSQRTPGQKGDLLVIRSTFTIKRSEYGINPGAPQDKVSDEIELTLSLAGASPK